MQYNTDDGPVSRSTKHRDQAAAFAELVRVAGERVSGQIADCGPERVTFGQLFDLVIADYQQKSSLPQTKRRIKLHLRPFFGEQKVISLRKSDIEKFKALKLKTLSPASVNRCISILRRSLTLGAKHDPPLVVRAIPEWFEKLEEDNTRTGVVSPEMYAAVMPEMAPHIQTAFCIGYHLGMRLGEILSLRWDQVDFAAGVIRLERRQTKAKKPRTAPIYGQMGPILEMARATANVQCPFVVQESGQRVFSIKTGWMGAFERAGLLYATGKKRKNGQELLKPLALFHDLRRTAATNMDAAGISRSRIKECVGWKTDAMFERYRIGSDKAAVETGQQMEAWMDRVRLNRGKDESTSSFT